MMDYEEFKKNTLAKSIACLDSIILSCREQQIELGIMLAKDLKVNEASLLQAMKESSIELLLKNGLDY